MSLEAEIAAGAGLRLVGAPGEVVRADDCDAFLREAERRGLYVTMARMVDLRDAGSRIDPRFEINAVEYGLVSAGELAVWKLFSGSTGDRGVEFVLLEPAEVDALAAQAAASRRRPFDWGAAPTLLLLATALGLTALLVWSVTTALSCPAT